MQTILNAKLIDTNALQFGVLDLKINDMMNAPFKYKYQLALHKKFKSYRNT